MATLINHIFTWKEIFNRLFPFFSLSFFFFFLVWRRCRNSTLERVYFKTAPSCTYTHTLTRACTYAHTLTHSHTYSHLFSHTHTCTHSHIHTHSHKHSYIAWTEYHAACICIMGRETVPSLPFWQRGFYFRQMLFN